MYDINDKFPKFGQDVYTSSVSADFDVFLQVEATDPDKGDSVKYSIVPGSVENHVTGGSEIDWNNVFVIDSKTGALTFSAKIDPSITGYLTLNITATDLSKFYSIVKSLPDILDEHARAHAYSIGDVFVQEVR